MFTNNFDMQNQSFLKMFSLNITKSSYDITQFLQIILNLDMFTNNFDMQNQSFLKNI